MNMLMPLNKRKNGLTRFTDIFEELDNMFVVPDPFYMTTREVSPNYSIKETEQEYKISLAIPGINKDNVMINAHKGKLSVSYENKSEKENEFSYCSFSRSWTLPENTREDLICAEYIDGVLKIKIPKEEMQKYQVKIK